MAPFRYLLCKLGHVVLQAVLVVGLLAHLDQDVKVAVFLCQRCHPLVLTQLHCNTASCQLLTVSDKNVAVSQERPRGRDAAPPRRLTQRGEQLGAALAVLHLQAVVALLLGSCGPRLLQGGQLGHVAAQVDVQQRHQLLTEGAAQLGVGVRVHRGQDDVVLAGNDGADASDAT